MDNEEKKACAFCNSETALALFGVALGVLFIVLSLDTLRRIRMTSTVDGEVVSIDDN